MKIQSVRTDKSWEEMGTLVFILFSWEGGQRVPPSENRKKRGPWSGQGSGAGGEVIHKTMAKDLKQMDFPMKEENNQQFLFGESLLSERKEKQCQKDTVSKVKGPQEEHQREDFKEKKQHTQSQVEKLGD